MSFTEKFRENARVLLTANTEEARRKQQKILAEATDAALEELVRETDGTFGTVDELKESRAFF